jgi:hypothetical protein
MTGNTKKSRTDFSLIMISDLNEYKKILTAKPYLYITNMGKSRLISSSFGCIPYSHIWNASACFTTEALSFPYHLAKEALTSLLIGTDLDADSQAFRSTSFTGTWSA